MIVKFSVSTSARTQFIDITGKVRKLLEKSNINEGICCIYIPHTTAGVTINENADPDVVKDIEMILEEKIPWKHKLYRHGEGNSAAHVKASMMGSSVSVIVDGGMMQLGTWQGIYFCEFDGPRTREVWISMVNSH